MWWNFSAVSISSTRARSSLTSGLDGGKPCRTADEEKGEKKAERRKPPCAWRRSMLLLHVVGPSSSSAGTDDGGADSRSRRPPIMSFFVLIIAVLLSAHLFNSSFSLICVPPAHAYPATPPRFLEPNRTTDSRSGRLHEGRNSRTALTQDSRPEASERTPNRVWAVPCPLGAEQRTRR